MLLQKEMRIGYMHMHRYGYIRWADFCQMQECYNLENNQEDDNEVVSDYETDNGKNRKAIIEKSLFFLFFLIRQTTIRR